MTGITLPAKYSNLTSMQRKQVREEYMRLQKGKCYHCEGHLLLQPPGEIRNKDINWTLFPPNFLKWPHHLHHSHDTDLTLGVVHAYCNAVLWQYHGE